jgi:O-antigen/teichoic acid export membrane protein
LINLTVKYPKIFATIRLPLVDQAVVSGNNFLQGVLLARALGANVFGAWAAGQLGLLLFLSLNQAFVTTPMLTFLGKKEEHEKDNYLQILAYIQVGIAVVGGFLAAIVAFFMFDKENLTPLQFGCAVSVFLLWDFCRRQLLSVGKMKIALLLDILLFTLQSGAFLILSLSNKVNLTIAWLMWTFSLVLSCTIGFWFFIKTKQKITFSNTQMVLKSHWSDGRWLLLTALLQWFAGNYFVASSAVWIGQTALGTARMAQNIVGVLNIVLISLENTLPISAAKSYKENGLHGLIDTLKLEMKRSSPMVFLFLGTFAIMGTTIFSFLFGTVPEGTSLVIWGYAVVYALTFLALPLRIALRTLGKSRVIFFSYAVSAVFSLALAPVFLQNGGLWGMVLGMVFCQVLQISVCFLGFIRNNR